MKILTFNCRPKFQRRDGNEKVNKKENNRFNEQNNNFARASHFCAQSLSSLHDYDVKMCSVFESLSPAHTKTLINGNTIASLSEHAFFFFTALLGAPLVIYNINL